MIYISPFILVFVAIISFGPMLVTKRYPKQCAWLSGFITAIALATIFIVFAFGN